ncbi:aminodeoxychorismate synthase component I [Actinopolymorpha pittospori]|uniref:aminodeoxychorismate synthase n=1 Tax=Actinopolymorpha pittospori TaxID=648752 RepID=A0A927N281_9ACTN|nr:para-aminobenzoate synthetase [Actinopolymorpha pittospori]
MTSWSLRCRELAFPVDTERAFAALFGVGRWAFWLDSSLLGGSARYSVLGESAGPHEEVLTERVGEGGETIFDRLERRLADRRRVDVPDELPRELACGYVGYFGYELKAHDGAAGPHVSPLPDACWLAATRYVGVDHEERRTWVVELVADGEPAAWLEEAAAILTDLAAASESAGQVEEPGAARPGGSRPGVPSGGSGPEPEPWLDRPRDAYLRDVETCLARLRAGESYEICLTNTVEMPFTGTPLEVYRRLRRLNPAPYAAYLRLDGVHVLSASPERFLTVDREGYAESRPIKGTVPRSGDPGLDELARKELLTSTKTRAENLMIVDLVRNDLGRVCEPGSITVPAFLALESYATVHHLVSTVRGRLRAEVGPVGAARACFPPGSMTGAPKLRTMRILDELESRARGIYSGALGQFGLTGTADLSVVIRTAVIHEGRVTVGAGGAIVLDSDPVEEWDEMLVKAAVPLRALPPAPETAPETAPGNAPERTF